MSPGDKFIDLCTEVSKTAEDLGIELTGYNVNPEDITGFNAVIKEF